MASFTFFKSFSKQKSSCCLVSYNKIATEDIPSSRSYLIPSTSSLDVLQQSSSTPSFSLLTSNDFTSLSGSRKAQSLTNLSNLSVFSTSKKSIPFFESHKSTFFQSSSSLTLKKAFSTSTPNKHLSFSKTKKFFQTYILVPKKQQVSSILKKPSSASSKKTVFSLSKSSLSLKSSKQASTNNMTFNKGLSNQAKTFFTIAQREIGQEQIEKLISIIDKCWEIAESQIWKLYRFKHIFPRLLSIEEVDPNSLSHANSFIEEIDGYLVSRKYEEALALLKGCRLFFGSYSQRIFLKTLFLEMNEIETLRDIYVTLRRAKHLGLSIALKYCNI